jgi:hypothetical protein
MDFGRPNFPKEAAKNEPLDDEGYERILRKLISIGVIVERYEFDPETGEWERMLDLLIPDRRYN